MPMVVAIDGPSGSGKSSTARGVASRLGLDFLDTGAMYRAATWLAMHLGVDRTDADAVAALVRGATLRDRRRSAGAAGRDQRHDVTRAIREPEVSAAVSSVATNLAVREHLVGEQRRMIRSAERAASSPRAATSPPSWRPMPTSACCWSPTRPRVSPAGRPSSAQAVDAAAVTDQVIRRDRDDSTVARFRRGRRE